MNDDSLLHRQVAPSWVQEGRITSQVFKPTSKDAGKLSVYDGDQIDAEDSWDHYTGQLGHSSCGVVSVTVPECESEELQVVPDPEPFDEHAYIDFAERSRSQVERASKSLRRCADDRGWMFLAAGSDNASSS